MKRKGFESKFDIAKQISASFALLRQWGFVEVMI